jgi:hypothetical protein
VRQWQQWQSAQSKKWINLYILSCLANQENWVGLQCRQRTKQAWAMNACSCKVTCKEWNPSP